MYSGTASSRATGSSVFPFLSVLLCTIGVLALILVAGSAKMLFKIPDLPERIERARQELAELVPKAEVAKKKLAKHEALLASVADARATAARLAKESREMADRGARVAKRNEVARREITARSARLAALSEKAKETLAMPEKVRLLREMQAYGLARDEARRRRDEVKTAADGAQKRARDLRSREQLLAKRVAEARKIAGSPEARFAVSGIGADKPPVYVELAPDSLTVHSAGLSVPPGTKIPRSQAIGEKGVLATLGSQQARHESSHCVVFLVRPGAVELFAAAVRVFRKWHAKFGHEPVDARWKLKFDKKKGPMVLPTGAGR